MSSNRPLHSSLPTISEPPIFLEAPESARVSGVSLLSLRAFLTTHYGEDTYANMLRLLPEGDALALEGIVLPVNWYSTRAYMRALHASETLTGDFAFFEKFGAFAADFQINAFRKFILRFTSPLFFLERAGTLWARTHNTGRWEVSGEGKHMQGVLRDFAIVDSSYCRVLVAWLHRASQLTRTRGHTLHTACRARGDKACVFEGNWS